ncbi:hypothetical protein ABZ769_34025 [Streptomyces olivoreticuli]
MKPSSSYGAMPDKLAKMQAQRLLQAEQGQIPTDRRYARALRVIDETCAGKLGGQNGEHTSGDV